MLSLSLRISCKFFVPKMFLRVVWESNLNQELSSFSSYFMLCQPFGNCLKIILALWSGGRSLHLQRLRLHLRPCIIVFKTLYNFSSSFETLYNFFRFFFLLFFIPYLMYTTSIVFSIAIFNFHHLKDEKTNVTPRDSHGITFGICFGSVALLRRHDLRSCAPIVDNSIYRHCHRVFCQHL